MLASMSPANPANPKRLKKKDSAHYVRYCEIHCLLTIPPITGLIAVSTAQAHRPFNIYQTSVQSAKDLVLLAQGQ